MSGDTLLEDIHITVRSDHAALARKLSKSVHDPPISPRQARWIERLMPFHIDFEYVPGKENVVSDALSRYPAPDLNCHNGITFPYCSTSFRNANAHFYRFTRRPKISRTSKESGSSYDR